MLLCFANSLGEKESTMAWLVVIRDTEQNGGQEFRSSVKKKKKITALFQKYLVTI